MVRFFHKELEAYLVAEGSFSEITEQGDKIYHIPVLLLILL